MPQRAVARARAVAKRPVLGKAAYIARVRRVLQTRRAQNWRQVLATSVPRGRPEEGRRVQRLTAGPGAWSTWRFPPFQAKTFAHVSDHKKRVNPTPQNFTVVLL